MLTVDNLLAEAESMKIRVAEASLPPPYFGCYDDERHEIVLASGLRSWQVRCALCHELVHAKHGARGCMTMSGVKAERRAMQEAAIRLIEPVEYSVAETVFDGDPFLIACELDVTLQVVNDYRDVLQVGLSDFRSEVIRSCREA